MRRAHEKCFICGPLPTFPLRDAREQRPSLHRDNTVTYAVVQKPQTVRGQGYGSGGMGDLAQLGVPDGGTWVDSVVSKAGRWDVALAGVWLEPGQAPPSLMPMATSFWTRGLQLGLLNPQWSQGESGQGKQRLGGW